MSKKTAPKKTACDLIGMGDSDKLEPSGPDRYTYAEHREHLFALWEQLDLGDDVVLVLHDRGSALGFDWAEQHRDRVPGIAYWEAIVTPLTWDDWPDDARGIFQASAHRPASNWCWRRTCSSRRSCPRRSCAT